jgi:hypothetical protein
MVVKVAESRSDERVGKVGRRRLSPGLHSRTARGPRPGSREAGLWLRIKMFPGGEEP